MVHKSAINEVSKEDLQDIINESRSYRVVLSTLGYVATAGANRTLYKRITRDNLDVTILEENYKQWHKKMWPEEKIYAKNSLYTRGPLKRRILRDNLIPYVCSECGNDGEWNGKKLVLQLEHINGISNDNRLKNLTFLCPNCHTQTDTYAGKKPKKTCQDCGKILSRGASYCRACIHVKSLEKRDTCQGCRTIVTKGATFCRACRRANKPKNTCQGCGKIVFRTSTVCTTCMGLNNRKATRPSREQLYKDLVELNYVGTGKKYGVTDAAIRNWCNGLDLPRRARDLKTFVL